MSESAAWAAGFWVCYHCNLAFRTLFYLFAAAWLALPQSESSEQSSEQPEPLHERVVVTGTYEPVPLEEVDRPVRAIDTRPLELLSNSWVDLLRLEPSLDLRQRAPNGVQGDLSIRGGTFGQTLILINGLRLNDVQSGHHNMNLPVPMESLSRVEILRGSGSTQYGSDAIGGVINLLAEPPSVTEVRLRTAVGSFGSNQQRGVVSLSERTILQQFTFSRDFSTGFMPNRDYRNLMLGSTTRFSSALGTTSVVLGHADRPFGAEQFYGNFNSWERTKAWFASVRQDLGQKTEAAFGYRRHTDLFVLYRDRPEVFTNRHISEHYQGVVRRREELSPNVRLFYGLEGYGDSIDSNNLGQHSRGRAAGYAALDVRALRRFSFSIGGREELYRNLQRQFSPTVSAGMWLGGGLKLRGSASRAFRVPSYTDLYYQDPANLGSPDLRPEHAWSYESGLDWNFRGRWRVEATVFQRRERDGIDYVRATMDDLWRATNIHQLRFTGAEAGLSATVARAHWADFRYTGLRGTQQVLGGLFSKYVFNYPVHNAVASWNAQLPGGMIARTRLGVTQRLARPSYALWEVYAAHSRGRVHPYIQVSNLTNTAFEEIIGVPMPGRALLAGIELTVFSRAK